MNQNQIQCNKLTNLLASPQYSLMLLQLGCTSNSTFVWLHNGIEYTPFTYKFDPDHYYVQGNKLLSELRHNQSIPAYSVTELERVIALYDYTIAKENKVYQITIEDAGFLKPITIMNERIADLFAAAVIELRQQNILALNFINELIRH